MFLIDILLINKDKHQMDRCMHTSEIRSARYSMCKCMTSYKENSKIRLVLLFFKNMPACISFDCSLGLNFLHTCL